MLYEFPQATHAPAQSDPRLLALRFFSGSSARPARAAARIGDEAGVAFGSGAARNDDRPQG